MAKKSNAFMEMSKKDTVDLLVGAFEGGSNYWYIIKNKTLPKQVSELYMPSEQISGNKFREYKKLDQPLDVPQDEEIYKNWKEETGFHSIYDTLLNDGELEICDDEKRYCGKLSMKIIRKKTPQYIKKHAKSWKRIKEQQEDAIDSDAFLQEMLFDDIIFG